MFCSREFFFVSEESLLKCIRCRINHQSRENVKRSNSAESPLSLGHNASKCHLQTNEYSRSCLIFSSWSETTGKPFSNFGIAPYGAKNQISLSAGGGGGGGGFGTNFQLLIPSLNLLKSKIPYVSWGRGGSGTNFKLLIPSLNLLKTEYPYVMFKE